VNFLKKRAFFFQGISLLLPEDKTTTLEDLELPLIYTVNFPQADIFTIPAHDGTSYSVDISYEITLPLHWKAIPVRQLILTLSSKMTDQADPPPPELATSLKAVLTRLLRAFHVAQWRRESVFCGSCGSKNNDFMPSKEATLENNATGEDNTEKHSESPNCPARLCPSCGRIEFPRIAPAIIVLITNDEDKVLLAHNKKFSPGVYSLIAGFVDAGENLEETAIREIKEEVNINVVDLQYLASQPWPFPNSLMVGFSARYASGNIIVDGVEIEDAQWFSRDKLPKLPDPGTVSRCLIDQWITSEEGRGKSE
jgi:NAD+ diphosphatase